MCLFSTNCQKRQAFWCKLFSWQCFLVVLVSVFLLSSNASAQKRNFRIGPLYFDLAAVLELEYNDNINSASSGAISDLIISPGISFNSEWKLTERNSINFNIGVNYRKYLSNPELDSANNFLGITPDTELSFLAFIDNFTLEFYDRLRYSIDATDAFSFDANGNVNSNVTDYGRFDNVVGVDVDWDLNDVKVLFGINRRDIIPTSSDFNFTQRTDQTGFLSARFLVAPNLTLGVNTSAVLTDYRENFQNDGIRYSIGPSVTWLATRLVTVEAQAGYTLFDFDSGGANGDNSQTEGLWGQLSVSHRMSRFYSHSLSYYRSYNVGFISNTTLIDRIRYEGEWQLRKEIKLSGSLSYEQGEDSGGLNPEDFDRYIFGLATTYAFSERISSELRYEFSHKDSSIEARTFDRNRVVLRINYDF